MMMMGDTGLPNPIVQVPPWDLLDDPTATMFSPLSSVNFNGNATSPNGDTSYDALTASLQRYLPSNVNNGLVSESDGFQGEDYDIPMNAFSCDQFRMFEFKVRRCARGRSHDWTECPYAHPGEKARRRDPRKYNYSGTVCSEFRKGQCKRGDSCELAHGVFESWLHPSRYRTQPCKDGTHCRRRVCFFAHTPDQLRILPQTSPRMGDSFDGSPGRLGLDPFGSGSFGSSPTSTLYSPPGSPPSDSPPMSPIGSLSLNSVSELAASVRNLQVGKARSPRVQMGTGFCSPRNQSNLRPGFASLPSTPTRIPNRVGHKVFELWENNGCEEEPVMERVESGKELRAQIYAKLSKENSLDRVDSASPGPDFGWVSELVM